MELYGIKINGFDDPVGCLLEPPTLSWKVRDAVSKRQESARVEVFSAGESVYTCEGDSLGTPLSFALKPYTRYDVKITVSGDAGECAVGSAFFETAKLSDPWRAKWIGGAFDFHPAFEKRFRINGKVKQARLYISGLGLFEAYLNGEKAGDDLLAPFINDYREHAQYCTYDVTALLKEENEISVLLGNGWYRGRYGLFGTAHYDRPFALIAELRIEYRDGSMDTLSTDGTWRVRPSCVTESGIYDGETQDYSKTPADWQSAAEVEAPAPLVERYSPPLTAHERLPVREVIVTAGGDTVLDFGQNFAGFVEVTTDESFKLEFGEILQNGEFYKANYRTAKSEFRCITDGKRRTVRPHFTFFGFRYVRVSGMSRLNAADFTGVAVYSRLDRTGFFKTGSEKINRLHENTLWGLKSNSIDMPTDCPQRDERLGWTGDANVFSRTAGYLVDTRAFYGKFLRDLRSDQKRNGGRVAVFLPNEYVGMTSCVWSDIATFLPNMLWDYYGDRTALRIQYPLMRDWVEWVRSQAKGDLWDSGFHFGDWLALDGSTDRSMVGGTDSFFIASAYYYAGTKYLAGAAKTLGYKESADYEALAESIKAAIFREYFTPSGRLAIDTQTGYLVALKFGLYPDRKRVVDGLKRRFKRDLGRIRGGFVGATMMNTVLAENGMAEMAYDLLFYEGFPSWLYAVNLGATTIWERWNSVLPDGTISGTGMNSLNHYSYGSVMEFCYRFSGGISPLAPGFRRVRIAPVPDVRLGHVSCSYDSASGRWVSDWRLNGDGSLTFHMEVPFDCTCELVLPEQKPRELSSGSYDFTIRTKRDYLALYDENTPMERLLKDERAVGLLGELAQIDPKDEEAMSLTLADLKARTAILRKPAESIDKIIGEIKKLH